MKRFRSLVLLLVMTTLSLSIAGCGDQMTIKGVTYPTYGVLNEDENKNPNVVYRVSMSNVIVGIIFSETIIVPVYIIGWDLFEPIGLKQLPTN